MPALLLRGGIARAPFLLGFIIGPAFESALQRSTILYGWDAFFRPGVLLLVAIMVAIVVGALLRGLRRPRKEAPETPTMPRSAMLPLVLCAVLALAALQQSLSYATMSALTMRVSAVTVLAALGLLALRQRRRGLDATPPERLEPLLVACTLAGIALSTLLGWPALLLPLLVLPVSLFRRAKSPETFVP